MKQMTPLLIVLSHSMGCMFPTSHSIEIITIMIKQKLMDWQLPSSREEGLLSSLLWDSRIQFMPILLEGDGNS